MTGLNYYVYIYYSEEWVPYYVGKGTAYRCFQSRNIPMPDKEHIHRFYFFTEQEAFDTEIQLIAHFGRVCDGGTLLNKTIGGPGAAGCLVSEETRAKKRAASTGRKHTEEARAKMSAAHKGRKFTEEHRGKLRECKSRTTPVWFVSPEQALYEVRSVTQFARDNDLDQGCLSRVS